MLQVSFTESCFMLGLLLGSLTTGFISDKFGRKKALLASMVVSSAGSLAGSFMPSNVSYLALRFITGCGSMALFNESFTLTVEVIGSKEVRLTVLSSS